MKVRESTSFGKPALTIDTVKGTWTYERAAGGFSSLVDPDGAEWIGFRPGDGSVPDGAANVFRGIPNLVYPDNIGHPGYALCETQWTADDRSAALHTRSLNGEWAWKWHVTEESAELQVERVPANRTYWFLYEGTPGGRFSTATAFWGTESGERTAECPPLEKPITGSWRQAYFGDTRSRWVLALSHQTHAGEPSLVGWMAADDAGTTGMVVFGFGRSRGERPTPHLEGNHRFVVSLTESGDHESVLQALAHGGSKK